MMSYSSPPQPLDNIKITEDRELSDGMSQTLSDLWEWIGRKHF